MTRQVSIRFSRRALLEAGVGWGVGAGSAVAVIIDPGFADAWVVLRSWPDWLLRLFAIACLYYALPALARLLTVLVGRRSAIMVHGGTATIRNDLGMKPQTVEWTDRHRLALHIDPQIILVGEPGAFVKVPRWLVHGGDLESVLEALE